MALSAEQLAQYEKMSEGQRGNTVNRFLRLAIPDGEREFEAKTRVLPTPSGLVTQGRTHYLVTPKKESGTCPLFFEDDFKTQGVCPACDFFFKNISNFRETPFWDNLKPLGPKFRNYFNVYDPESGQVLIWSLPADGPDSFGNSVLSGIVSRAKKGIDVTDPVKGRNLNVTLRRQGAAFNYAGIWDTRSTKLPKSIIDDWEDELHDLEEIPKFKVLSTESLQASVDAFIEKVNTD